MPVAYSGPEVVNLPSYLNDMRFLLLLADDREPPVPEEKKD